MLVEKLTGFQLVNTSRAFYGIRRFITAFTSAATSPYPEPDNTQIYNTVTTTRLPQARFSYKFRYINETYANNRVTTLNPMGRVAQSV